MKVGIIGGGNMGSAILKSIRGRFSVSVCEESASRRRYLQKNFRVKIKDLETVVKSSKVLILAVKPQNIDSVLKELKSLISKRHLVISIAAGITNSFIEKRLGSGIKVVRTMPNMPAQIGEGITALAKGKYAKRTDVLLASRIFNCVGQTVVVKEDLIDAVTAVSGSGPAYVFLFAEAMNDAAKAVGLSQSLSDRLVLQTLKGSVRLLESSQDSAATLRAKVTSKGGTTQAAMNVFKKNKVGMIYKQALAAAKKRAKQLSRR